MCASSSFVQITPPGVGMCDPPSLAMPSFPVLDYPPGGGRLSLPSGLHTRLPEIYPVTCASCALVRNHSGVGNCGEMLHPLSARPSLSVPGLPLEGGVLPPSRLVCCPIANPYG